MNTPTRHNPSTKDRKDLGGWGKISKKLWWLWMVGIFVVGLVVGKYADEIYDAFLLMAVFTKYWLANVR